MTHQHCEDPDDREETPHLRGLRHPLHAYDASGLLSPMNPSFAGQGKSV